MPKSGARLSHPREKYPRRYQTFRALIYSIHIKNPPPCSNPPPPFTDRGYRFPSVIPKKKKIDLWIISRFSSTPSFEPTQSRTFPTEGNFCIHSPRVEGQEVRREEEEEEGGVDRESASNEIDFPLIRLARVHTRDWAPWGGQSVMNKKKKKKVSHRVRRRINGRTVFDPFRLPPIGARLNGLPASWTSSRDTDHRGAFRSWWPGSSALAIVSTHGWLIHSLPPPLSFFLSSPLRSSFSSRAKREFSIRCVRGIFEAVQLFCTCEFLPRVSYFGWYTFFADRIVKKRNL